MDITYDPCGVVVQPAAESRPEQIENLAHALALWNEAADLRLAQTGAPTLPRLLVRFEPAAVAFRGVYEDEIGIAIVNSKLNTEAQTITIAHELGHAFGLWHVDASERRSLMNPGNIQIAPTSSDAAELRALWGACASPPE